MSSWASSAGSVRLPRFDDVLSALPRAHCNVDVKLAREPAGARATLFSMGTRGGRAALLLLCTALACGGRMLDPDPGGSAGTVAATSNAGQPQTGGSSAMGCEGASCPLIGCLEGYAPAVPAPGQCCSGGCVLDCRDVACSDADLDCDPGLSPSMLPDECCPLCLPGSPKSCEDARQEYESLRGELMALYNSGGCDAAGCSLFVEGNRCAVNCGTPIWSVEGDAIAEILQSFADQNCTLCPRVSFSCSEPAAFSCQANNTCQFDPIGAQ